MTRKEAKELLPVIQAFAEGKTIEVRVGNDSWVKTDEVYGGRNNDYDYRIKPEPKYRPFKDSEECWQEMQKHQPFGWLKHKTDNVYSFISKIDKDCCYFAVNVYWGFDTLFKTKTFIDGTPFGIKE